MTDQNKTVFNRYFYTPFGLITNQQEYIPQPFKYAGKYGIMHEPNGFYYMRARYYDPSIGRFISEDPSGFDGGDVNLYAYVGNNPINRIDPLGLEAGGTSGWVEAWDAISNFIVGTAWGAEESDSDIDWFGGWRGEVLDEGLKRASPFFPYARQIGEAIGKELKEAQDMPRGSRVPNMPEYYPEWEKPKEDRNIFYQDMERRR